LYDLERRLYSPSSITDKYEVAGSEEVIESKGAPVKLRLIELVEVSRKWNEH